MCGIVGFLDPKSATLSDPREIVTRMTSTLRHRGPDHQGVWLDDARILALGHRRLSIVDLSATGYQPMLSASQRFVIAFNGEIYNHSDLRAILDAEHKVAWRGSSDTETLLAAIEHWGVKAALERSVGMFAIALWDVSTRTLTLARDRMGEKPLYYGRSRGAFLFASELKAFHAFPGFEAALDPDALGLYMTFGYVSAPRSIFKHVYKLMPGTLLTVSEEGSEKRDVFWSLDKAFRQPRFGGTAEEAADEVERRLKEAIRIQSVADVPLGAFLSGGIDSSTIVALMQDAASRPVHTFCIGFEDENYNEARHAAEVAHFLGTDHVELIVTPADALALVPCIPEIWDEPFADPSQIPTRILSALARQKVTVSLSGDGGDELFLGYDHYFSSNRIEKVRPRRLLRFLLRTVPHSWIAGAFKAVPNRAARGVTAIRLENIMHRIKEESPQDRYIACLMKWRNLADLIPNTNINPYHFTDFLPPVDTDFLNHMSGIDTTTYLPDDILVKVDRAAMATSLETRIPLLDHRVVELAVSLPSSYKFRDGQTKWPLRRVLNQYVPRSLIDRPKRGFSVPIADWLRGPLREWADDLLSLASLARDGVLNPDPIVRTWQQHRSGTHNWENRLWTVLMFQAWRAHYVK
jgi:asparagine synthase (glutamine-hydrolysing)